MTKKILLFFILTISVLIIGGGIFTAIISRNLPDPALMENRRVSQSTKIYDRTGQIPLYEISPKKVYRYAGAAVVLALSSFLAITE